MRKSRLFWSFRFLNHDFMSNIEIVMKEFIGQSDESIKYQFFQCARISSVITIGAVVYMKINVYGKLK